MKTFETLGEARSKATTMQKIIKIRHRDAGVCYIITKCPLSMLAAALRKTPMPEIKELLTEYDKETDAEIEEIKRLSEAEYKASTEYAYKQHVAKINGAMTLNGRSL